MSNVIEQLEEHINHYRKLERDILELWFHLPSYQAVKEAHPNFKDLNETEKFMREHYSLRRIIEEASDYFFSFSLDYVDAPPQECPCGCTEEIDK